MVKFPGAEGETVRLESEAVSDVSKGTKATSKIAEVEDDINAVEKAGVEVGKFMREYLIIHVEYKAVKLNIY